MKYEKGFCAGFHCRASRMLAAAACAAVLLFSAACGRKSVSSTADYIGIDAAKEAALKAAEITSDQASFVSAGLDSRNGTFYYQVIFQENGTEHEYAIDALTGVVIEEKHVPQVPGSQTEPGGAQAASNGQGTASPAANEQENDSPSAIAQEGTSPSASAQDGDSPSASAQETASFSINTREDALSAVLAHAGLTEEQVSRSEVKQDMENGRSIFEVEIVTVDGTEYDYELSAEDGSILSYDFDVEASFRQSPAAGTGIISEDQAKQAVLNRVPGALAVDVVLRLKEDDGRMEYEGKIVWDNMEYEFTIDAYSGGLIEWEAEAAPGSSAS